MDASSGFADYARVAESVPHFSGAPRRFAGHDFGTSTATAISDALLTPALQSTTTIT
jgi:hypothetical protein